jgi:hypothetical protein
MTYHKIEGPFMRSEDLKTVDRTKWRNPVVEMLADTPIWVASEKVDGTNIRVIWDGYRISFAGRTDRAQLPGPLVEKLESYFLRPGVEEWFEENFPPPTEDSVERLSVVLYGEGYGGKIQSGGKYRADQDFIGFDVSVNGRYLSVANVADIFERLNVPVLTSYTPTTLTHMIQVVSGGLKSQFGDFTAEGLVARTIEPMYDQRGNRLIVKLKDVDLGVSE